MSSEQESGSAGAAVGAHGGAGAELHAAPDTEAGGDGCGGDARRRAPRLYRAGAAAGALCGEAYSPAHSSGHSFHLVIQSVITGSPVLLISHLLQA